jgi:hypothetical protein
MAAYDLNELGESLKADGLVLAKDTAEVAARKAFTRVYAWLKKSAAESATPIDDIALGFFSQYEKVVLAKIDEINGKVG